MSRMGHKLQRVITFERQFESLVSYLLIIGLVSLSSLNAIMRYFFSSPIQWTEEVLVACFIWLTFWSIGLCYRHDQFIHIDFIDALLSAQVKKMLLVLVDLSIFLFSFVVLYWSLLLSIQASVKLTNILRIPYSYIYISLFLGFLSLDKEIVLKYLKVGR